MSAPTLADVKTQLNITSNADDAELQSFLDAAQAMVEARVGTFAPTEVTETVRSRGALVLLTRLPVQSVTSLVATAPSTTTYATADLAWTGAGVVRLANGGSLAGEWVATYDAGLAEVPANVRLATLIIVQHLWKTQRGGARRPGMDEDALTVVGAGYALPNRAAELLSTSEHVVGFA